MREMVILKVFPTLFQSFFPRKSVNVQIIWKINCSYTRKAKQQHVSCRHVNKNGPYEVRYST